MAGQDFAQVVDGGLLRQVEEIVVEGHRKLVERHGGKWSRPAAYHWLRYEDPDPLQRLIEGARRLREGGVKFDAKAVDKACAKARERGFLN
ncbi:MAG TPA: hypothetical protein VJT78_09860 [Candidatus Dormibacteraeota bacterium]|nr:hypothetical protein [Candidatus Dormibacteraeota bacterium]